MTGPGSAARGRRRAGIAGALLVAWVAGLGLLARRELFRPATDRMAEIALRVNPGAVFYAVEQDGRRIGFASSTIDTLPSSIELTDYFVADLVLAGKPLRASARSFITTSRALALRTFQVDVETDVTPVHVGGRADGDSAVVFALDAGDGAASDSQRVAVQGPILLPTLVPLAVLLGDAPRVGREATVPVLDPAAAAGGGPVTSRPARFRIAAESLFTVDDSARFDVPQRRWIAVLRDTVRAWRVEPVDGGGFSGWVDAQGRVVESVQAAGLTLKRMAYELAFENWRIDRAAAPAPDAAPRDILESTAIAADREIPPELTVLRARLRAPSLAGFDLDGGRQRWTGDTLSIQREQFRHFRTYALPGDDAHRARFREYLRAEPLLQVQALPMAVAAVGIAGPARDAVQIARRLTRWVYDSVRKEPTFSLPNALQVLQTRRGDCNEHTQLYIALARALGLPARFASGLAYVDGKFYYHAWPEVWLGEWVAVDPTWGQFPADASHLRFTVGGLARQAELLRLIGNLGIDVLEAK